MKKNIFILILLMSIFKLTIGQDYWNTNENLYENSMNITAIICIDGLEQNNCDYEIAAFCDDELRGNKRVKYEEILDKYLVYLTIYGDDGFDITFKIYDHKNKKELNYALLTSLEYEVDATLGNPFNPVSIDFDAVTFIGNGSWNLASNWKNSILPTTDDDVIIDGSAIITNGNNIVVNSIKINDNKSMTIESGAVLKVHDIIANVNPEALIINDGGQIIQTDENVAATFKKNIVNPDIWSNPVSGWQFISTPIIDAETADFASTDGDYDLYKFDGTKELQWVNYKNADFEEIFTLGRAYIASYQSQTTASFKGTLNAETSYFEFPVNYYDDNFWANFYLIGNPFSFNMDWNNVDFDTEKVENGFATVDANTGVYIYKVNGAIKVGEGIMIHTHAENPYIEYDNSKKKRDVESNYINITASNNKGSDNVIIRFEDNESSGFPKLDNFNKKIANIYVKEGNAKYGIMNFKSDVNEIPLYFEAKEMGKYTINADASGDFNNVILVDRLTGIETNLLLDDYTFTSRSNDHKERFVLKLAQSSHPDTSIQFAYQSGEELIINAEGTIQIVDMLGRIVVEKEKHDGVININCLRNAAYIVRCVNKNEVKTQKIIVL